MRFTSVVFLTVHDKLVIARGQRAFFVSVFFFAMASSGVDTMRFLRNAPNSQRVEKFKQARMSNHDPLKGSQMMSPRMTTIHHSTTDMQEHHTTRDRQQQHLDSCRAGHRCAQSQDHVPSRTPIREPQLVEVPTVPVSVEQTVDIPVLADLQGFLPEQSLTASGWLDGGRLPGFSLGQGSAACASGGLCGFPL